MIDWTLREGRRDRACLRLADTDTEDGELSMGWMSREGRSGRQMLRRGEEQLTSKAGSPPSKAASTESVSVFSASPWASWAALQARKTAPGAAFTRHSSRADGHTGSWLSPSPESSKSRFSVMPTWEVAVSGSADFRWLFFSGLIRWAGTSSGAALSQSDSSEGTVSTRVSGGGGWHHEHWP